MKKARKVMSNMGLFEKTALIIWRVLISFFLLFIKRNRVRKLDAALRIELSLQAYETCQTTKPSQTL